ncbi:hypothetical protein SO802_000871 [Lithocarpus litseifolius]|uniref:Reverse transcriptase domain-containing protein n=1 Tax=Lithocarpus litseifolius TaxID=425828 RepID=A0AAW2DVE8_9ROSI
MIMQCVTTVTYSILLNGEPKGFIRPSRGLRQGDPLFPFLFLFCAEGLNALRNKAADNGEIRGLSLCRQGPKITHFFLQAIAFFCRAKKAECQKIQQLLGWYEAASGQLVNKDKTTLFFSRNTPEEVQQEIKILLGVPSIKHYGKYLGLPYFEGRQKKACLNQIKERIWAKMQGWKEKLLSQAGKEVRIKAENRSGDFTIRRTRCCIKFLSRSISLREAFWTLTSILGVPLHGKVSYKLGRSLIKEHDGE